MDAGQSSQNRHLDKIKGVLGAVKDNNWQSLNEFLIAYYTSDDASVSAQAARSLTYINGQQYGPERTIATLLGDKSQ